MIGAWREPRARSERLHRRQTQFQNIALKTHFCPLRQPLGKRSYEGIVDKPSLVMPLLEVRVGEIDRNSLHCGVLRNITDNARNIHIGISIYIMNVRNTESLGPCVRQLYNWFPDVDADNIRLWVVLGILRRPRALGASDVYNKRIINVLKVILYPVLGKTYRDLVPVRRIVCIKR